MTKLSLKHLLYYKSSTSVKMTTSIQTFILQCTIKQPPPFSTITSWEQKLNTYRQSTTKSLQETSQLITTGGILHLQHGGISSTIVNNIQPINK